MGEFQYIPTAETQLNRGCTCLTHCRRTLQWRHNDHDSVSNHQPHGCLLNRLFRRRSRNIKAPRHWPLWGEFSGIGEFPAQRPSYAENVSIWWRHHDLCVNKPTGFGSNNGLSPGQRQAIIWTNGGILFIGALGTNLSEISEICDSKDITAIFAKIFFPKPRRFNNACHKKVNFFSYHAHWPLSVYTFIHLWNIYQLSITGFLSP